MNKCMNADEYVQKYMMDIKTNAELRERLVAMFSEITNEFTAICEKRNVQTVKGQEGVVRELNEKWNAIASRVEKMYHKPVVKRNAVWNEILSSLDPVRWPPK